MESKVVGDYDKSRFAADYDGPYFGVGQAWFDEDAHLQGRQRGIQNLKVHVPHDGKIFEVYEFQFLCCNRLPEVCNTTYPTRNWVTVSDGHLPPNVIAAGVLLMVKCCMLAEENMSMICSQDILFLQKSVFIFAMVVMNTFIAVTMKC